VSMSVSISVSVSVSVSMTVSVNESVSIKYGATNSFVRRGNYSVNFQGLYEVARKLKGPLTRGDGQNQLKISAPLPERETYRLIPLSAGQISLDSPFNA
jgi:hypothetical protein